MPAELRLKLTDYVDPTRWRWVLEDESEKFITDHEVALDPDCREYEGFRDLSDYLEYRRGLRSAEEQLAELGAWVGEQVFGPVGEALRDVCEPPATAVHVVVPDEAQDLLFLPFELARFEDGARFTDAGVRFIYQLEGAAHGKEKVPPEETLRVLAVFSLPVRQNPLNLRRERHGLQQSIRELCQTRGVAVELRVLQYGATRESLEDALQEGEGWDVVHASGHGREGAILLEDDRGGTDEIDAGDLEKLLRPAKSRLKLLVLDACHTGASHAAARAQVGLEDPPVRQEGAEGEAVPETEETVLPSLGQELAQQLDCAALAMRYPVGDAFATDLALSLYDKLLKQRQPLPQALHLAMDDAMNAETRPGPMSRVTPILIGPRGAALQLRPPDAGPTKFVPPHVGLRIGFPPQPDRFVGRLQPMLRASQALAPESDARGVLFHGMPGAGKTACALELAYRHERDRFRGYVWYCAPEEGGDVANALFNVLFEIERQLNAPGLGLTAAVDDPERFSQFALPRLKALLEQHSILLVLDNLETLLTSSNGWRDEMWGPFVEALLAHNGPSRVVLTSRRVPRDLDGDGRVLSESIHALSFAESVLLARELPNLKPLFEDEAGRKLLRESLRMAQGHPKLLELADGLATDRRALSRRVEAAADRWSDRTDALDAFLAPGGEREGETRQGEEEFLVALKDWTAGVVGGLPETARLLFEFLCRLEPPDRTHFIVEANWKDFLERLGDEHPAAQAALNEPEEGLPAGLEALEKVGLVEVERPESGQEGGDSGGSTTYGIHPGVAEAVRAAADPFVLAAADVELGDFHGAMYNRGRETEMEGGGRTVVGAARRAAPYLMRQSRWEAASTLLEQMLHRDESPSTLAFALPLLRHIAEATEGTDRELVDTGVLAKTLAKAGRTEEAAGLLRDLIERSAAQGNYRVASVATGDLLDLLHSTGRLTEALELADEKAEYTRRAGLGPWTQLGNEVQRLQVLTTMGRYEEVLSGVEERREEMEELPLESEAEESVDPWNVREAMLDAGCQAAFYSKRWETVLSLNAQIVEWQEARGADALEVARRRFNDHGPLLRLGRYDDARSPVLSCRKVFEKEHAVRELGAVYSALADLEDETDDRAAAVRFEEIALGHRYRAGQPEGCAISHHNLANYLEREDADPATVLAHRLAAGAIRVQIQSGRLPTTLRSLARSELPPGPPSFAEVVARVESIEGVQFGDLFERLPRTTPDGDAAIAEIWRRVGEEKQRMASERQKREDVLASMPPEVQSAIEAGDVEALHAALEELPPEEAEAAVEQLREAGILRTRSGPDRSQVIENFVQDIAAAVTDESLRPKIEEILPQLEENGWRLTDPVHRIWSGERDPDALTDGIDDNSAQLIRHVLELLADGGNQND